MRWQLAAKSMGVDEMAQERMSNEHKPGKRKNSGHSHKVQTE